MDLLSRVMSPYDLNAFGFNPLLSVLTECLILIGLLARQSSSLLLFITATNVRTDRGRIFRNSEITVDVLFASACLRTMFRAVENDGESYWDGGYAGNSTITPLIRESDARDTILVQINPLERHPGCRRFVGEYGLWRTNQALQLTNGSSCWKV
jgi:NTE family protein